jgi:lysozyme
LQKYSAYGIMQSTMNNTYRNKIFRAASALVLVLCLLMSACGDPHKGQVQIFDGSAQVWITPEKGVPVSTFNASDFKLEGEAQEPVYVGTDFTVSKGIDVSYYQQDIDWMKVAASGVEFAFIRCGYRGYTAGTMSEDEKFKDNIAGALKAGLQVGVYFFSQAVTAGEAAEEAQYVIDMIKDYNVTLPLVFDWERIDSEDSARTAQVDGETVTACAAAFCEKVKAAGYEPCIYFYRNTGYYVYDLTKLTDYTFWVSTPGNYPDFYYAHTIWQYSFEGQVPGIAGNTDLDMIFTPVPSQSPQPS